MPYVRDLRGPCHVKTPPDADPGSPGRLPTIATSDKRYSGGSTSLLVKPPPPVDCQGTDGTRARVDADGYAPDADDVDDGLPYLGDDDEWIRDFLKAYFSAWGRVARAAGAALAIVGVGVWSPSAPPPRLALRMRILARQLYIGGGSS